MCLSIIFHITNSLSLCQYINMLPRESKVATNQGSWFEMFPLDQLGEVVHLVSPRLTTVHGNSYILTLMPNASSWFSRAL